jgi:arsenate reductase (glutaredoxin)
VIASKNPPPVTILWHNPRCSKSRETLALIAPFAPKIRLYLQDPPSLDELRGAAALLGSVRALLRAHEDGAPDADASDEDVLIALSQTPRLIERPVVFHQGRAAIGRPPEATLTLFQ